MRHYITESDITFSTNQSLTASINSNTIDANPGQTNALGQIESNMGGGFDGSDSIGYGIEYGTGAENIGSNGDIVIDNNAIDFSQQDFNSNFDNTNEYEVVGITVEIEIDAISSKLVNNAIKNPIIGNKKIWQSSVTPFDPIHLSEISREEGKGKDT